MPFSYFKCAVDGCNETVITRKYCRLHTCAEDRCYDPRLPLINYCISHKCPEEYCGSRKNNCRQHGCLVCSWTVVPGSKFCSEHKCPYCSHSIIVPHQCTVDDCDRCIKDGGRCEEHLKICRLCDQESIGDSWHCLDHKCDIEGCRNHRQLDSVLCYFHLCRAPNCSNVSPPGQSLCQTCFEEMNLMVNTPKFKEYLKDRLQDVHERKCYCGLNCLCGCGESLICPECDI